MGSSFPPASAALLERGEAAAHRPQRRVWECQAGNALLPSLFPHLTQDLCLQLSPESASTTQGTEGLLERLWLCIASLQEQLGLLPLELPLKEEEENKEEEEVSGLQWSQQRNKSKNKTGKSISHGKLSK